MLSGDNIFHNYKDHNPFWAAKAPAYIKRKEYLFHTLKQRTPGRLSKASIVFLIFSALYGNHMIDRKRKEMEKSDVVNYEFQRKALPFLQAVEDRRFLAVEQRNKWLADELFKNNKEEYLALSRIYNDPTVWIMPYEETTFYLGGVPKTYKSPLRGMKDKLQGADSYLRNLPDSHF